MKKIKINGGKENGGSTVSTTMNIEAMLDFLEVSGVSVETFEIELEDSMLIVEP